MSWHTVGRSVVLAGGLPGKVAVGTGELRHWMGWIAGLLRVQARGQDLW